MTNKESKSKRIPLLSQEEFNELGKVMYSKNKKVEQDFWEKTYAKRGLIYVREKDLVSKFDELLSSGRIHLNLVDGLTVSELSDDDKIKLMKVLDEIEIKEVEEYNQD